MRGSNVTGYFHVCTDGRMLPWMFQDEEDFIAGVNRVGICCLRTHVIVVAFVLMDNHVHFVLYGNALQCKQFITLYKQLVGTWIHIKYGLQDYLKMLPADILLLDTEERLLNTIAYIDRNPVVAGYKYLPTEYPWGSARCFFKTDNDAGKTKTLSTISRREQRKLLGTRVVLPGEWRVDENGMICLESFMDVHKVELLFKTAARYSYFLTKKLEGTVEQDLESSQKTFLPDKELREVMRKMIHQDYDKVAVEELDINARLAIARKLRYDYASPKKQVARMVHLELSALEGYL